MLRTFTLSILLFLGLSVHSQSSFMTISRDTRMTVHDSSLNGMASVVFKSDLADLIISTTVNSDPICDKPKKVGTEYWYVMNFDPTKRRDIMFVVSKKGSSISQKTDQVLLNRDESRYFNVEVVSNPISIERADASHGYLHSGNGWALIEIISEMKVDVSFSSKLIASLKSGRSKSGAYIDSLIINVYELHALYDLLTDSLVLAQSKLASLNALDSTLLESANNLNDDELRLLRSRLNALETQKNDLSDSIKLRESQLNELTYVSIKGDGTNERVIEAKDILDLQNKGAIKYNIMLLSQTVSVFKTKYEEMVNQAVSHKNSRDYASAKMYYENAAKEKDASESDIQAALQSAQQMDKLAKFKAETDVIADKLYELSANNKVVNKDAFVKMIDEMVDRYNALYRETGDAFYQQEALRLEKEKSDIGFVFKGRIVLSEYKGGTLQETPLTNVVIYGSYQSNCEAMDDKDYLHKGVRINTEVDSEGRYSLTLKPGRYKTLIFEAQDRKIKKNKHVSLEGRTDDRNVKIRFSKD